MTNITSVLSDHKITAFKNHTGRNTPTLIRKMYTSSNISFHDLYTSYHNKSTLFVKSYVNSIQVAEDIVSDALISVWEQQKIIEIENIQYYLIKVLKNKTLDYLKHAAVERKAHELINEKLNRELDVRISLLESCDPDELLTGEIQEIYRKTMDSLPEKTRAIFEMNRFGNKSNKEIADYFGISVKGVDYHISQAIRELRNSLKDYLPIIVFFLFK
jgi:RNA polymerase sigma-70 factor (ECF subfamily)